MARHKNGKWNLPGPQIKTWEQVQVAVLMDIRDELQTLNTTLACYNFQQFPHVLKRIDKRLQNAGMLTVKQPKKKK